MSLAGPIVAQLEAQEEMSFKGFLICSSGGGAEQHVILVEGIMRTFMRSYFHFGQVVQRGCRLKKKFTHGRPMDEDQSQ